MKKDPSTRAVNAGICIFLLAFIVLHAAMGGLAAHGLVGTALSFLAWAGVVAIAAHVLLSIATSAQMLADTERPPSSKKKRHLALKWATGGIVVVCVMAHVACSFVIGPQVYFSTPVSLAVTTLLIAALATHICVGSKSLLKDIGLDRRYRAHLRVGTVLVAIVIFVALASAYAAHLL